MSSKQIILWTILILIIIGSAFFINNMFTHGSSTTIQKTPENMEKILQKCYEMEGNQKDRCIRSVASGYAQLSFDKSMDLCNIIGSPTLKMDCVRDIVEETKDKQICQKISQQEFVNLCSAFLENDGSYCSNIIEEQLKNECSSFFEKRAYYQDTNNAELDKDNDGMPNQWELQNGLDPDDASDASLDHDEDGLTNLEEYQAGTDPMRRN